MTYDVSSRAYLRAAWESIASTPLFWDHANVFVIIATRSGKIDEHGDGSSLFLADALDLAEPIDDPLKERSIVAKSPRPHAGDLACFVP